VSAREQLFQSLQLVHCRRLPVQGASIAEGPTSFAPEPTAHGLTQLNDRRGEHRSALMILPKRNLARGTCESYDFPAALTNGTMAKQSDTVAEVRTWVDKLRAKLPQSVDVAALGVMSKAPFQLLCTREALIWRTEELARTACDA